MELLEVMDIVERKEGMNRVEREDLLCPVPRFLNSPVPHLPSTPVEALQLHLFDHDHVYHHGQNGYGRVSPHSRRCSRPFPRPGLP